MNSENNPLSDRYFSEQGEIPFYKTPEIERKTDACEDTDTIKDKDNSNPSALISVGSFGAPDFSIDDILENKNNLNKVSINHIIEELALRTKIRNYNLSKIDDEILKIESQLLNFYSFPPFSNPVIEKRKDMLQKEILALEKEKRMELSSGWRDGVLLKRDLTYSLKDYMSMKQKMDLIKNCIPDKDNYQNEEYFYK